MRSKLFLAVAALGIGGVTLSVTRRAARAGAGDGRSGGRRASRSEPAATTAPVLAVGLIVACATACASPATPGPRQANAPREAVEELQAEARSSRVQPPVGDDEWRAALLDEGVLRLPRKWPVDAPYVMGICMPPWLPIGDIEVQPSFEAARPARARTGFSPCGWCVRGQREHEAQQEVGVLAESRLTLHVRVRAREPVDWPGIAHALRSDLPPPAFPERVVLWEGDVVVDVELVDGNGPMGPSP